MSSLPDIRFERPLKECASFTGQRQSGKTELAKKLIWLNPNPMTIFDTLGVISEAVRKGELQLRGNQKLINPEWNKNALPSYDDMLAVFLPVCEQVWRRGNQIFFVEEWHLFNKSKFALPAPFGNLFNQGGNKNIAVQGTSQRPAQVHNDILASCTHHFVFSLWMPQDLRWMSNFIPKRYVESDDPKAVTIANLQPYHFFYYNTATKQAEFFQPISI